MKWWQLLWLLNDNPDFLRGVLTAPEWAKYSEWLRDREKIRLAQDREILDAIVPDSLCLKALPGCRSRFLAEDGCLYGGFPETHTDKLTAVEVYRRYGRAGMVDAIDKGVARITERHEPGRDYPEPS